MASPSLEELRDGKLLPAVTRNLAGRHRYTFVTVGYDGEIGLLRLQARSMRLYCPADLIDQIIVVDNSQPAASNRWRDELLHQYGSLASLVRFIPAAELAAIPANAGGWYAQQVLKIKVAEIVQAERYVLLDAKNHLISQLGRDFLETADGLPRMNGHSLTDNPMQGFLVRTLTYVGIDPGPHLSWFPRTTTPFTMLTSEARDVVRYIENREGKPFASAFLEKQLSEFFLYSAFLESKGILKSSYDFTQPHTAQLWGETADEAGCVEAIRKARKTGCPFMATHSKAIAKLDERARMIVAQFWQACSLFPSVSDGIEFLRDPNGSHQDYNGRILRWSVAEVASRFRQWKTALRRSNSHSRTVQSSGESNLRTAY